MTTSPPDPARCSVGSPSGDGLYRRDELSVAGDPATAGTDLRQALSAIATDARAAGLGMSDRTVALAPRPVARVADDPRRPDGYLRANADGTFSLKKYGTFEPYTPPKSQATSYGNCSDCATRWSRLLEAEATTIDDTDAIDELRAKLNTRYTTYAANYGPINRFELRPRRTKDKATGRMVPVVDEETGLQEMRRVRPPQGRFRDDPFAPVVAALENFDEETQTAADARTSSASVWCLPARLGSAPILPRKRWRSVSTPPARYGFPPWRGCSASTSPPRGSGWARSSTTTRPPANSNPRPHTCPVT